HYALPTCQDQTLRKTEKTTNNPRKSRQSPIDTGQTKQTSCSIRSKGTKKVQNLALTIKHTVEFSNNRRTPSKTGTTAPTPSGATLQPYPISRPGPNRLGDPIQARISRRGLPLLARGARSDPRPSVRVSDPGGHLAVSGSCRADFENITRPRPWRQLGRGV